MCPAVKLINDRGGTFANNLILRANNCFWDDVFTLYKNLCYKYVPVFFHDLAAERLYYNINICRDKKVIYIRNWTECDIVSVGHILGPHGYLSYEDFKAIKIVMLYEGIVRSVRHYQAKRGLEFEETEENY